MNRILMRRIKSHRRPERFHPFRRTMGHSNKVSCGTFVGIDRSTEKGLYALRFFVRSGRVWLPQEQKATAFGRG
jgi:hypothetical protein